MPTADYNPVFVHLEGDIDLGAAGELLRRLTIATGLSEDVVIDLRDVTFLDSSGVGILAQAVRLGATLVVDEAPPNVRRIVEISGLIEPVS